MSFPSSEIQLRPPATIDVGKGERAQGVVSFHSVEVEVMASLAPQLINLTSQVQTIVETACISTGQVTVFCMHTTAALILNEDECLLHKDMVDFLEELSSSRRPYRHDDMSLRTENLEPDHGRNGHAHLKQLVLGSSVVIPVWRGRLYLGKWQKLFLLELDRPRPRTVLVQVSGVG